MMNFLRDHWPPRNNRGLPPQFPRPEKVKHRWSTLFMIIAGAATLYGLVGGMFGELNIVVEMLCTTGAIFLLYMGFGRFGSTVGVNQILEYFDRLLNG